MPSGPPTLPFSFPVIYLSDTCPISRTSPRRPLPKGRKAYRRAWADFLKYCEAFGKDPLPARPVTVAAYITESIMGV